MLRTVEFSKAGLVWGVRNKFVAAIDKPRIGALPRKVGIPPLHASQKAEHRRRRSSEEPNVDVEKRSALLWRHRSTDLVKPARAAHRWRFHRGAVLAGFLFAVIFHSINVFVRIRI